MVALRLFLKERGGFSVKDITASNWPEIERFANTWGTDDDSGSHDPERLNQFLPAIDVWISIADNELRHVAHLIPSLDWDGDNLGVRIRIEAKSFEDLRKDFVQAQLNAKERGENYNSENNASSGNFSLWPKSLQDYLDRKFTSALTMES